MKHFLKFSIILTLFFACKKQNYAQFQTSNLNRYEEYKKSNINVLKFESAKSEKIYEISNQKIGPEMFEDVSNTNSEINILKNLEKSIKINRKNLIKKNKISETESNIVLTDSTSKKQQYYNKIAGFSGFTLFSAIVLTILGIVLSISFLTSLAILLFLVSVIFAFISIKRAKKPYRIWPILSITLFLISLIPIGIIIYALSNLKY